MKTNNITYRRVGDFNIPNLILPPEESSVTLGKWGMMHKDYLVKQIKVAEGITEKLKEKNQLEWICRMQNIEARVREIICKELIYA